MTKLLRRAFHALGEGPSAEDIRLVAASLRRRADSATLELLRWDGDHARFDALAEIAERAGSSGFVALDLATEVHCPDWREQREQRGLLDVTRRRVVAEG